MVADPPSVDSGGGLELSARAQTVVLGSGALVYIGIVSFVVTCFGSFSGVTQDSAQHQFYSSFAEASPVEHLHTIPSIVVAHAVGDISSKGASDTQRR